VYLERMEIGEEKSMIDFPLHIGTKWDVYIKSEELDTTKSNKPALAIKKRLPITIIKN
jgi:hypothetical protein